MKRFLLVAGLVASLFACTGSPASSQDSRVTAAEPSEADIRTVAARALPVFLEKIPEGAASAYGFASSEEMEHASIGRPFRVILARIDRNKDAAETLQPLDEWRVPITVDESARALLTVVRKEGTLRAVDFGAAGLSRALETLEQDLELTEDTPRALVRAAALRRDFLYLNEPPDAEKFYLAAPPTSGTERTVIQLPTRAALPAAMTRAEVFAQIRAHREANIHE